MASGTQSSSSLQNSKIASLFFKVPKTAELVVYELSVNDTTQLLLYTEPAIYHFCRGPGGGFDRFLKICREGKRYRWNQNRLPDPPRLLVEQWQRKLLGKRLVDEDAESSEDTFKESDIPRPYVFGTNADDHSFQKNRLNIGFGGSPRKVTQVYYG